MRKIFEAYYIDNTYNKQFCKFYEDMFLYAVTSQNTLFTRYIENLKEHTHYLILQSIETTQASKVKKSRMRNLSEFLSLGIDGFWLLQGVIGKTWEEKNVEIERFIKALCVFVGQNQSFEDLKLESSST